MEFNALDILPLSEVDGLHVAKFKGKPVFIDQVLGNPEPDFFAGLIMDINQIDFLINLINIVEEDYPNMNQLAHMRHFHMKHALFSLKEFLYSIEYIKPV